MRWLIVLLLAGCPARTDRTGDPAIGRWRGETGKTIELRADGSLDMDPITAPGCDADAELLRRCRARQRWRRSGATVILSRAAIAGPPCDCRYESIDLQLRGDDLVFGHEHARRVR